MSTIAGGLCPPDPPPGGHPPDPPWFSVLKMHSRRLHFRAPKNQIFVILPHETGPPGTKLLPFGAPNGGPPLGRHSVLARACSFRKNEKLLKNGHFLHPAATLARRLPADRHAVHVRRRGPGQKIFRKIKNCRDNFKNDLAAGLLEKPGAGRASVH